jgi:stearoyl-CoA desaturase (Delta-9 desaturase)
MYIRMMEMVGLATVRKTVPTMKLGSVKPVADSHTLEAIIANRYEVMAKYAAHLRTACRVELERLKAEGAENTAKWRDMHLAKRWLHRDEDKIPVGVKAQVANAWADNEKLKKLVIMREELRQLWTRTNVSAEQLVADLQAWCKKAEESGIAALQEFALKLRAVHA